MKTSSAQEWLRLITVLPLLVVLAGFLFNSGGKPVQGFEQAMLGEVSQAVVTMTAAQ